MYGRCILLTVCMVRGCHVCSGAAIDYCVRSQVGELSQCPQQPSSLWIQEQTARDLPYQQTWAQVNRVTVKQSGNEPTPHIPQVICMAFFHFVYGAQCGLCPTDEVICVKKT